MKQSLQDEDKQYAWKIKRNTIAGEYFNGTCLATPREAHNCEDGVSIKLAYRTEFQEKNERWRKRRDGGRDEEITAGDGGGRGDQWVDGSVVRVDEVGDKIAIKIGGEEEMVGGGDETMIGDINGTQDKELVE
ncbi:hypothetical protein HID58_029238 [Brassica napus]|uniref:Uncharacterized protein n=1 Tax=Brassica napus TaxID=3708 RepID=A0ABQ8CCI5_BRANA|nr:hypothetical protein HID58_029238 [Brassica napus]